MPDIPTLIHCHICGYWSGPTTAEDNQARVCNHCGTCVRVYRYPEKHPRSKIGCNTMPVMIIRRVNGASISYMYAIPKGVNPRYVKGAFQNYDHDKHVYYWAARADARKLKDIKRVRYGGVMYGEVR